MKPRLALWVGFLLTTGVAALRAQPAQVPSADKAPFLRLESEGPISVVTTLAFSPDGKTLYYTGFDKVVRSWTFDQAKAAFIPDRAAYRVPIGPGLSGALNTLALSDDGALLAVGGRGPYRGESGFRDRGIVLDTDIALGPRMRQDVGMIYVFDTKTQALVKALRGCHGEVRRLAFAPSRKDKPVLLVSASREWEDGDKTGTYVGAIRLWDVAKETPVSAGAWDVTDVPPQGGSKPEPGAVPDRTQLRFPGLAVWHTGPQPRETRVAFAWDDGRLQIWDAQQPDGQAPWSQPKTGKENNTAVYLPGTDSLLTTRFLGNGDGQLETWADLSAKEPRLADTLQLPHVPNKLYFFPRALAALSSGANGRFDLVAMVETALEQSGKQQRLRLFRIVGQTLKEACPPFHLWKGSQLPLLATAPHGEFLAVGSLERRQVVVYSIRDLLNGVDKRLELQGDGELFQTAIFAIKGKDQGLLLSQGSKSLVFDFAHSTLTGDTQNWKPEAAPANGWSSSQTGPATITVQAPNGTVQEIKLPGGQNVSTHLLLAPLASMPLPLLAVAGQEPGDRANLGLYDARSGRLLRRLYGHTDVIHSLAFSADGRFLASVAEDQTVCVWSLTDLGRTIGRHGRVSFHPRERNGIVRVGSIPGDDPLRNELDGEDQIEALVEGKQVRPLTSLQELVEAAHATKSGGKLVLRVRGVRGIRNVAAEVIQETDERKPLFTFFAFAPKGQPALEWIGWSPLGPYESSGVRAERRLGWHFNTGQPRSPTRFAAADQYRKEYFHAGLLRELIERGEYRVAERVPRPPLRIALFVEDQQNFPRPDAQNRILVRQPEIRLHIALLDRTLDSLKALTWQVDDQPARNIDLKGPLRSEALVPVQLPRGAHTIRVQAIQAPEPDVEDTEPTESATPAPLAANTAQEQIRVRYHPPAPKIELKGPVPQQIVDQPVFRLRALVHAGRAGEGVTVKVSHRHQDKVVLAATETLAVTQEPGGILEKDLHLLPGLNLVELSAANSKAPAGSEALETGMPVTLQITLIEKARPPLIALQTLTPDGIAPKPIGLAGQPLEVDVSKVVIAGRIEATENLLEAGCRSPAAANAVPLAGFVYGKDKRWEFKEAFTLQPGEQVLQFSAKTPTSDRGSAELRILFRPPVPLPQIVAPARGTCVFGDEPLGKVPLACVLKQPRERHDYNTAVLVNGKATGSTLEADGRGALSGTVSLPPGESTVQVKLTNQWGSVQTAETRVSYARPPRVLALDAPAESKDALVDLTAHVRSPVPLLAQRARLFVNGTRRFLEAHVAAEAGEPNRWLVRFQGVPLEGGPRNLPKENSIVLSVGNAEADCLVPTKATITYKAVQPPPIVEIRNPADNAELMERRVGVSVLVRSTSPLKKVQLVRRGSPPQLLDLAGQRTDADGCVLSQEVKVDLVPFVNELRLEAVNEGGAASVSIHVTAMRLPPSLEVTELWPEGTKEPVSINQLGTSTPQVLKSRAKILGWLRFDEDDDQRASALKWVRVAVNGFLQPLARLGDKVPGEAGGWRRPFQADILLNDDKNRIEFNLVNSETAENPHRGLIIGCNWPDRNRRLHILIVCPTEEKAAALQDDLSQAIGPGTPGITTDFTVLAGAQAHLDIVRPTLQEMTSRITSRVGGNVLGNDIVLVYYRGEENVTSHGHFFALYAPPAEREPERFAMTCDWLAGRFTEMPGAQILLLDVRSPNKPNAPPGKLIRDKIQNWEHDFSDVEPHAAVVRFVWLGQKQNPPKGADLIAALEEALPETTRLVEVWDMLRSFPNRHKFKLTPSDHIPADLYGLIFGRKHP